jgi:hypothetical protein
VLSPLPPQRGDDTGNVKYSTVTAFGAAFAAPRQTAAVLRARASAAGLSAKEPSLQDLAAAVVGAQAWMGAFGVSSLADVRSKAAAAALAAVYCRAAGQATSPVPASAADCARQLAELVDQLTDHPPAPLPQATLAAVFVAADWACQHETGAAALLAAAEDLSAGWDAPELAAVSEALVTLAGELL